MHKNIIIMGPPGAGKTTVSKIISEKINLPVIDIDDDILESVWGCTVGEKLDALGDDGFLEAEGEALMTVNVENHIISLSGSNPLHGKAMQHMRSLGTVVFLDVPTTVIMERLSRMKVDRIVGMKNQTLPEILEYRRQFYENSYDIRIPFFESFTPEKMAERIIRELNKNENYLSTRGHNAKETFSDVVRLGLAPDGGLYVPKEFPRFHGGELYRLLPFSYTERAQRILEKFPLGNLHPQTLKNLINEAYQPFQHKDIVPTKHLKKNLFLSEQFYGPTASFKDIALQLTPKFFAHATEKDNKNYLVLAATSGDTGVAAMEGFKKEKNISVAVLFPKKGVSEIQRRQMLSQPDKNVMALAVESDFDFCQSAVKEIFSDELFKNQLAQNHNTYLTSANSINWGRLLPQVVYHISGYLDLINQSIIKQGDEVNICVPSGNFGNILSALYARHMGIPVKQFICASNDNNILTDFIKTGRYNIRDRSLIKTISPSIDILKSSNVERLIYFISEGDAKLVKQLFEQLQKEQYFELPSKIKEKLQSLFAADFCSEKDCAQTIKKTLTESGRLIDTHTAVAVYAAQKHSNTIPTLISATAHWSKFGPAVLTALGGNSDKKNIAQIISEIKKLAPENTVHPMLDKIWERELLQKKESEANIDSIKQTIIDFVNS